MNHALGNIGKTVVYTDPIEARPEDQTASLGQLVEEMDRGLVEMLVILAGNPVFTAPADLRFGERLVADSNAGRAKVPLRIHLSQYVDETSARCDWHLPETHYLEAWSDARAYDGMASIVQPLIAPLYGGKSSHEVLAILAGEPQRSGHDLVRSYWRGWWDGRHPDLRDRTQAERDDAFAPDWKTALHDGWVAGTAFATKSVALKKDWAKELAAAGGSSPGPDNLEIVFRPDPSVFDGRLANNGWLQELPKPLTRLDLGQRRPGEPGHGQAARPELCPERPRRRARRDHGRRGRASLPRRAPSKPPSGSCRASPTTA